MNVLSQALTIRKQYNIAFSFAILSISFALAEAIFSTYYGYSDESLTLFGFGVGSFIEVVSAVGIAHMIIRIKHNEKSERDKFEKTALRITGSGFYLLFISLIITCVYNIWKGNKPETTFSGIIISLLSITIMLFLFFGKTKVGKKLNSDAVLSDANCTKVCIYTSIVLLIASGLYELTNFKYIDEIGTLGIAYFAFKEGKESFENAKSNKHCSCC